METVPENEIFDHEASKVHFSNDVSMNTEINIVCKNNDEIDVHIGFLQEGHTYEVHFPVPNKFPDGWKHPEVVDPEFRLISVDSIAILKKTINVIRHPISIEEQVVGWYLNVPNALQSSQKAVSRTVKTEFIQLEFLSKLASSKMVRFPPVAGSSIEEPLRSWGRYHKTLCDWRDKRGSYKNRLLLTTEWRCTMEGKVKKRLTLHSRDGSRHVKICIDARVMGKNKGTPMLKNGIKCIHIPDDSTSEASDWQGFD